eukprot:scaffold67686_cov51-Cyclotella_meneghiniana.AAC.3
MLAPSGKGLKSINVAIFYLAYAAGCWWARNGGPPRTFGPSDYGKKLDTSITFTSLSGASSILLVTRCMHCYYIGSLRKKSCRASSSIFPLVMRR